MEKKLRWLGNLKIMNETKIPQQGLEEIIGTQAV